MWEDEQGLTNLEGHEEEALTSCLQSRSQWAIGSPPESFKRAGGMHILFQSVCGSLRWRKASRPRMSGIARRITSHLSGLLFFHLDYASPIWRQNSSDEIWVHRLWSHAIVHIYLIIDKGHPPKRTTRLLREWVHVVITCPFGVFGSICEILTFGCVNKIFGSLGIEQKWRLPCKTSQPKISIKLDK